ncbi:hypothetical protein I4U23_029670 [Adineta vaga]|nr:hypothetical protein I4U23_029670 [Adineta vaga]
MSFVIVFIPGYQSVVPSRKSIFLQTWCHEHRHRFVTFNHDFVSPNASVGTWFHHLLSILDHETSTDKLILIGSSLGAWLALLVLLRKEVDTSLKSRIHGILALGTSINGTEKWLNEIESNIHRSDRTYIYRRPSSYSSTGYYDIPVSMLLDSKQYLLPVECDTIQIESINCILIFMHGMHDVDASYQRVIDLVSRLQINRQGAIEIRLIHDGDHRLSRDEDLLKIQHCLNDIINMTR